MRGIWTTILLVSALATWTSCGSVMFGSKNDDTKPTNTTPSEPEVEAVVEDCDALMQELAENCFMMTAYAEDGVTVLHVIDEVGNDLGEIDLNWVAAYCECYAQLSFQTFGCSGVLEHEKLDDAQYEEAYGSIRSICAQPVEPEQSVPMTDVQCASDDLECLEWLNAHTADAEALLEQNDEPKYDVSHCQVNDTACIEAARVTGESSATSDVLQKTIAE